MGKPTQRTGRTRQHAQERQRIRRKVAFLRALKDTGNVGSACKLAGIGRTQVYAWYNNDRRFAKLWDSCLEIATDALEAEARRRAIEGVQKPVYQGGKKVGTVTEYSDRMLELLLKAHRPAKYRERVSTEISGPNGGPIEHIDTSAAREDLARRVARLAAGAEAN